MNVMALYDALDCLSASVLAAETGRPEKAQEAYM